jgi:hypothetical protein
MRGLLWLVPLGFFFKKNLFKLVGGWVGADRVSAPFQNTKLVDQTNPCGFVVFQPVTAKKKKK